MPVHDNGNNYQMLQSSQKSQSAVFDISKPDSAMISETKEKMWECENKSERIFDRQDEFINEFSKTIQEIDRLRAEARHYQGNLFD
jgi:uncharacterized coiled-coil DUF342 family protein